MTATHLLGDPKVVVVGAGGTIGLPVVRALSARHEVARVGRTRGDYQVNISSRDSIARLEMPRRTRINVVSPPWVAETLQAMGRDPSAGLPAAKVAAAYVESVEGRRNGDVLDARRFG